MTKKVFNFLFCNPFIHSVLLLSVIFYALNLFPKINSFFGYIGISTLIFCITFSVIQTIYKIDINEILEEREKKND